jgi:hypothetical protein
MMTFVIWVERNHSWIMWLTAVLVPIIIFEVGECSSRISEWVIRVSAGTLGVITTRQVGGEYRDQWLADLLKFPGKLTKIILTLGLVIRSVPRLWWIISGEEIPGRILRRLRGVVIHWQRAIGSPKPGVEVALLDDHRVAIRSRRSKPSVLAFTREDFQDLIDRAKRGELDSFAS